MIAPKYFPVFATMESDWPFLDLPNTAVITLRQIAREGQPILYVSHDEDGSWQFLGDTTTCEVDVMVVSLANILRIDPEARQLADLPPGWFAWRRRVKEEWARAPNVAGRPE